jgi:predicted nucleotidyltransferase
MTPRSSPSSAGAIYLDREQRIADLRAAAGRAVSRMPAIRKVILFGSLAAGIPGPRSDADLLVEVSTSPHGQPRDRIPELLRALSPLPCPVDLFVLTTGELARLRKDGSPLLREILRAGIDLL